MNLSVPKSPPCRSYVVSLHLALNGFWAQRVIIGWLAWDMTGSAGFVGLVAFLNFFPPFLLAHFSASLQTGSMYAKAAF